MLSQGVIATMGKLSRLIVAQFEALGIDVYDADVGSDGVIRSRLELVERYSTEAIPTAADTEINFFQKARAGTGAHARGLGGTNLDQANGVFDTGADNLVVGIGVDFLVAGDAGDTLIDDVAKVRNYGMLTEVVLQDRRVLDPMFLSAFPIDRGFSVDVGATGHDAAAVNVDQVVNGRPGGNMIRLLPPSNRIYIPRNERIDVRVKHYAAAALSATLDMRLHFLCARMQPRNPNPGK